MGLWHFVEVVAVEWGMSWQPCSEQFSSSVKRVKLGTFVHLGKGHELAQCPIDGGCHCNRVMFQNVT